jgi:hypothetical protein
MIYEVSRNLDSTIVKYHEDFQKIKLLGTERLLKAYVVEPRKEARFHYVVIYR